MNWNLQQKFAVILALSISATQCLAGWSIREATGPGGSYQTTSNIAFRGTTLNANQLYIIKVGKIELTFPSGGGDPIGNFVTQNLAQGQSGQPQGVPGATHFLKTVDAPDDGWTEWSILRARLYDPYALLHKAESNDFYTTN